MAQRQAVLADCLFFSLSQTLLGEACGGQFILSVGHFAGRHFFYGHAGDCAGVGGDGLQNDIFEAGAGNFAGVFFCIVF